MDKNQSYYIICRIKIKGYTQIFHQTGATFCKTGMNYGTNNINLKLETIDERLTPGTGVAIFGEYLKGGDLKRLCNTLMPLSVHRISIYSV